jgi:hypothetical protein
MISLQDFHSHLESIPAGPDESNPEMIRVSTPDTGLVGMDVWYWSSGKFVKECIQENVDSYVKPRVLVSKNFFDSQGTRMKEIVYQHSGLEEQVASLKGMLKRLRVGYLKELEHLRETLKLSKQQIERLQGHSCDEIPDHDPIDTEIYFYDIKDGLFEPDLIDALKRSISVMHRRLIRENSDLRDGILSSGGLGGVGGDVRQILENLLIRFGFKFDEIFGVFSEIILHPNSGDGGEFDPKSRLEILQSFRSSLETLNSNLKLSELELLKSLGLGILPPSRDSPNLRQPGRLASVDMGIAHRMARRVGDGMESLVYRIESLGSRPITRVDGKIVIDEQVQTLATETDDSGIQVAGGLDSRDSSNQTESKTLEVEMVGRVEIVDERRRAKVKIAPALSSRLSVMKDEIAESPTQVVVGNVIYEDIIQVQWLSGVRIDSYPITDSEIQTDDPSVQLFNESEDSSKSGKPLATSPTGPRRMLKLESQSHADANIARRQSTPMILVDTESQCDLTQRGGGGVTPRLLTGRTIELAEHEQDDSFEKGLVDKYIKQFKNSFVSRIQSDPLQTITRLFTEFPASQSSDPRSTSQSVSVVNLPYIRQTSRDNYFEQSRAPEPTRVDALTAPGPRVDTTNSLRSAQMTPMFGRHLPPLDVVSLRRVVVALRAEIADVEGRLVVETKRLARALECIATLRTERDAFGERAVKSIEQVKLIREEVRRLRKDMVSRDRRIGRLTRALIKRTEDAAAGPPLPSHRSNISEHFNDWISSLIDTDRSQSPHPPRPDTPSDPEDNSTLLKFVQLTSERPKISRIPINGGLVEYAPVETTRVDVWTHLYSDARMKSYREHQSRSPSPQGPGIPSVQKLPQIHQPPHSYRSFQFEPFSRNSSRNPLRSGRIISSRQTFALPSWFK